MKIIEKVYNSNKEELEGLEGHVKQKFFNFIINNFCPDDFGLKNKVDCDCACNECWNREYEEE